VPGSANDQSILPFLKRQYPKGLAFTGYKKSKMLAMLKTDTSFGGEGKHYTVSYAPTNGNSANYQRAYQNQGPSTAARFFLQHRTEYGLARIKHLALAKTMGDKNAIKNILTEEFDKAGYAFGRTMASTLYGNGGGARGLIASTTTISSDTIDLTRRADIAKFEVGDWIELATDDGSGVSPTGLLTGQLQVLSVSLGNSTTPARVKLSAAINTIAGAATGNYIFRSGDYGQKMTGLGGWNPLTAPSGADSFFSVNRSLHEFRLAGFRHTGNGGSKEATLLDAAAGAAAHGCSATFCAVNPLDYNGLIKEVGADRVVDVESARPGIGFKALRLETAMGTVDFVSEVDVPQGEFFFADPKRVELATAGDCPRLLDFDGQGKLVRVQGEDASQFDIGAYGNIGCEDPSQLAHGTF
jgi:hypothetical protein